MSRTITRDEMARALRQAALDQPARSNPVDLIKGTCLLTYKDGSHCIYGQALVNLGVDVPEYGEHGFDHGVEASVFSLPIGLEDDAYELALRAQGIADEEYDPAADFITRPSWAAVSVKLGIA